MKIGIYGGTFNPPHLGHMDSAQAAMALLGLDKLLFIPALQPPHKELPPDTASAEERFAMAAYMADGLTLGLDPSRAGDVMALDLELRRAGKSYTADTLAELHAQFPDAELWLLLGTDMFLSIQQWHEPEKIMSLAGVAAFSRGPENMEAVFRVQGDFLRRTFGARVCTVALPHITDIASTQLRPMLAGGGGGEYLWPQVYGYILRHKLYGVDRDLKNLNYKDLRAASYSMVKAKRVPHIRGTEMAAMRLAERWGADVEKARRAAILHDCTKYEGMEKQLALCRRYGVELDELEREAVKLLHSKTGAWIARDVFGADDDIFSAIYWHTTGKADMTVLEKILYLADYMEPTRNFPGVERLRALSEESLDEAVLMGLNMSVQEMEERKLAVHHNTLEARAYILNHRE